MRSNVGRIGVEQHLHPLQMQKRDCVWLGPTVPPAKSRVGADSINARGFFLCLIALVLV